MIQPRLGFSWDVTGEAKSVLRANFGVYNPRQNMLTQVGSVTANGLQQQTIFRDSSFVTFAEMPVWPNVIETQSLPEGEFPLFTGVRAFDKDYKNPRITSFNVAFEQEISLDWSVYGDFTYAEGDNLTRFFQVNRTEGPCCDIAPGTGNTVAYGPGPFGLALGDVFITNSSGRSEYRGATFGFRKRYADGFQVEANYVLSKDEDDDSNERDPFTDRSFNIFDTAEGLRALRPRHPAQVQLLRFYRARPDPAQCPGPGTLGPADHRDPARARGRRSRAQRPAEGQRVLLTRLAPAMADTARQARGSSSWCPSSRCSTPPTARTW